MRIQPFSSPILAILLAPILLAPVPAQDAIDRANFKLAEKYSSEFLRHFSYSTSVSPKWIGKTNRFWYGYRTSAGQKYWLVDAEARTKVPLFDHGIVAGAITEATEKAVDATRLSITDVEFDKDGKKFEFSAGGFRFGYDRATDGVEKLGKAPRSSRRRGMPTPEQMRTMSREQIMQWMQRYRQRNRTERDRTERDRTERDQERGQRGGGERVTRGRGTGGRGTGGRGSGGRGSGVGGFRGRGGPPGTGGANPRGRFYAPDRSAYVFAKDHNLFYVAGTKLPEQTAKKADAEGAGKAKVAGASSKSNGAEDDATNGSTKGAASGATHGSTNGAKNGSTNGAMVGAKNGTTHGVENATKHGTTNAVLETNRSGRTKSGAGAGGSIATGAQTNGGSNGAAADKGNPAAPPQPARAPRPRFEYDEASALQLSKDGVEDYSFGGATRASSRDRNDDEQRRDIRQVLTRTRGRRGGGRSPFGRGGARVTWSEDSAAFFTTRRDSRGLKELFLVNSLSNPRPTLRTYKYAMPGDERVRTTELYYFHKDVKKLARVQPKWQDESYQYVSWDEHTKLLTFMRRNRLLRNVELCALEPKTGKVTTLFAEGSKDGYLKLQRLRRLKERKEFLWWSERTGWGHYYLFGNDGKLKNAITRGAFRASSIVDLDEDEGVLYFRGNGREKNENVYYEHLYRVRLDGTGLTLLDPGNASHRSSLSPSKRFVVDNWSRVDQVPGSALRDSEGNMIMKLEECDLSKLLEVGWRMPETFTVKAADGMTDLYGNMWKPFDFDPQKKYPIIANVYPGPQQEGVRHTFSSVNSRQQLAQIGFVVIQVGHRGGSPKRSRAYANYGYYNMRDYGLADKKAAIEQLAMRFPFIDVDKVGIYGHSGGGFMTAAALLQKPYNEFFKVGVASSGNHDNNIYNSSWSERYHGLKQVAVEGKKTGGTAGGRSGRESGSKSDDTTGDKTGKRTGKKTGKKTETRNGSGRRARTESGSKSQSGSKTESGSKSGNGSDTGSGTTTGGRQGRRRRSSWRERLAQRQRAAAAAEQKKTKFEIHVPTNAELAANLKGHLLLVHGELDNNVHPANTMRLVDALIQANKRFDMLIIPGARHSYGKATRYFTHRMWEYFAEHLIGAPPTGADLLDKSK